MKNLDFPKLSGADVLDLAILIEEEARQRYHDLSTTLGTDPENNEAAESFAFLAEVEFGHRAALEARRWQSFPEAPTTVDASMAFDVEAPGFGITGSVIGLSHCLALALTAEEKAERFYRDAALATADRETRDLFVQLADEEVQHQELLFRMKARLPQDPNGSG